MAKKEKNILTQPANQNDNADSTMENNSGDLINEISKVKRDKIVTQALSEIIFDRRYKQGKIKNWQKNERMYYMIKTDAPESRANIELGKMQDFVHGLQAKIDNPLVFTFKKRKDSQLQRVERLNALRASDQDADNWDLKDQVGKKQAIIYGRAVYSYFADSEYGYCAHLENIDVYDFLIDPDGGGIDMEAALNMGAYGLCYTKEQLLEMKKDDFYDSSVISELISGTGNNTESPQEVTNKRVRQYGQNTIGQKANPVDSDNKYRFWRWCTTWFDEDTGKSERYYLVLQERAGKAIRISKLTDLFPANKMFQKGPWPFWSYAMYPDLTEFWSPAGCDYVRELFQAQNVSVNQGFDNSEAINKPQKVVNVNSLENLSELKYRRDGTIRVKNDIDVNKAIQFIRPPAIETPIKMYNLLEGIYNKTSNTTKIDQQPDDKVAIYEGNQEADAEKTGLFNKSYSFGYKRFARLYELGVREHLTKKVAVEIIGPDGIDTEMVKRSDIFRKDEEFTVMVEASDAETQLSGKLKAAKLNFLNAQATNQLNPAAPKIQNPQKAYEISAKIAGFEDEEIKELTDTSDYGSARLMSEVSRDFEDILDGKKLKPNPAANNAYLQRFKDMVTDHQENLTDTLFAEMTAYMAGLKDIVMKNEARALNQFHIGLLNKMSENPVPPGDQQPQPNPAPGPVMQPQPNQQ